MRKDLKRYLDPVRPLWSTAHTHSQLRLGILQCRIYWAKGEEEGRSFLVCGSFILKQLVVFKYKNMGK